MLGVSADLLSQYTKAATVYKKLSTRVGSSKPSTRVDSFDGLHRHLYEISKTPEKYWPALAEALTTEALSVNVIKARVERVKSLEAAKQAGMEDVPVYIETLSDDEALIKLINGNRQRGNNPLDIGLAALHLTKGKGGAGKKGGQAEYARQLGVHQQMLGEHIKAATVYKKLSAQADGSKPTAQADGFIGLHKHLYEISKAATVHRKLLAQANGSKLLARANSFIGLHKHLYEISKAASVHEELFARANGFELFGRANGFIGLHAPLRNIKAAEVHQKPSSQIDSNKPSSQIDGLSESATHLYEISKTPEKYWPALSEALTVEAAKQAGMEDVPVYVETLSDDEALIKLINGNRQRGNNPLDIGLAALHLTKGKGGAGKKSGRAEYARMLGVSKTSLAEYTRAASVHEKLFGRPNSSKPFGRPNGFIGLHTHLYEISKAPEKYWQPLSQSLTTEALSVNVIKARVDRIKSLETAKPSWLQIPGSFIGEICGPSKAAANLTAAMARAVTIVN